MKEVLKYLRANGKAGDGVRLAVLVLHDDAAREYAYGPALGLPDSKVGISMNNDWKSIFAFEK
jgi:hypothetical protein